MKPITRKHWHCKLLKMEKKYLITRREFSKLALIGGLTSLLPACGGGGGGGPKNKAPGISVFQSFKNDGTVDYNIIGQDADGQVIKMDTRYNDENFELHQGNNIVVTKPINKQANTLEIIATDNAGGTNKLLHTLSAPTRETAYNQIKQMLDSRGGFQSYEAKGPAAKASFFLNNTEYSTDFLITRTDGRFSVINYIAFNENTLAEQINQKAIKSYYIDNLFLYKLPTDEITKRLDEFIKASYLTKFE